MTAKPLHFVHLQPKDPHSVARCTPPTSPPPFQPIALVLKQVDPQRLGDIGRAALTLFSSFWQDWDRTKETVAEEAKTEVDAFLGRPGWDTQPTTSADRRFSGDGHLPRGRYFSVCHSPDGWDGGTMVRELTAYHDPLRAGILDIHDVQDEMRGADAAHPRHGDDPPVYLLDIPGFLRDSHPWLRPFVEDGHDAVEVALQASVTNESFQRLIDLRIPAVAEWFTQNLTRLRWLSADGEETAAFPRKPPLDRFVDLLPTLLVQRPGGGAGASLIAGQWLRCLGADGLVFPSVRSDASVTVRGGQLERSRGWNLVDFRDAPPIRLTSWDLTSEWVRHVASEVDDEPLALYSGVTVESGRRPWRRKGSWRVQGLEQVNADFRTFRSALALYRWAVGSDLSPACEAALTRATAGRGPAAESLGRQAAVFIRALFGDADLQQGIMTAYADLAPEDRAQIDLGAAFRGMKDKLAAIAAERGRHA
ncbi:hypothetical protein [Geodermatophilus sp. SYSU D01176]